MTKRLPHILLAGLVGVAALTALTVPAAAAAQYRCTLPGGIVRLVDAPIQQVGVVCTEVATAVPTTPTTPTLPSKPPSTNTTPSKPPQQQPQHTTTTEPTPTSPGGSPQAPSGGRRTPAPTPHRRHHRRLTGGAKPPAEVKGRRGRRHGAHRTPLRRPDGVPTPSNPGFIDALPGPSSRLGVPNFVIEKFRVPPFLLSIYQAAGIQYGIRWEVLAAINEIETDYGRNLNVSSAGAVGWMQFIPSTWRRYGVDANRDGKRDPYNPVDAIFAAARYLKAAGYSADVRRAIFAYNHADWYVDSVLLRARLIAGVPADLIGSLTGLTEGRFPVYARARYADDLAEQRRAARRAGSTRRAARLDAAAAGRRGIDIFARRGAPVVAVNDGVVKKIGRSRRLGRYLTLQDVFGNRYTYAELGTTARYYPVPKGQPASPRRGARALKANAGHDPRPTAPASAGRQPARGSGARARSRPARRARPAGASAARRASAPVKQRLFAHPGLPASRRHGGLDQLLDHKTSRGGFETFRNYFSRPLEANPREFRLRPLRKGAHVIGGTVLGRIGHTVPGKAAHLHFEIRPAGRGAPRIDPKPILDGWKLLEATAIYRAHGKNALRGGASIGQILLMPKPLLERRVLTDPRIEVYPGGREDIRTGQVDRRVLAALEYLAESGLKPTVSCLKSGHSYLTSSGNVSEHSSGNAVDISKINGIPILGHQDRGGVADQTVRTLMRLQGTLQPHQIISLLDYGKNTLALPDHNDHVHIGYRPLFGTNRKLGRQALAVLKPGQWSDLLDRLRHLDNPTVPTKPSRYALPTHRRASTAHRGE